MIRDGGLRFRLFRRDRETRAERNPAGEREGDCPAFPRERPSTGRVRGSWKMGLSPSMRYMDLARSKFGLAGLVNLN